MSNADFSEIAALSKYDAFETRIQELINGLKSGAVNSSDVDIELLQREVDEIKASAPTTLMLIEADNAVNVLISQLAMALSKQATQWQSKFEPASAMAAMALASSAEIARHIESTAQADPLWYLERVGRVQMKAYEGSNLFVPRVQFSHQFLAATPGGLVDSVDGVPRRRHVIPRERGHVSHAQDVSLADLAAVGRVGSATHMIEDVLNSLYEATQRAVPVYQLVFNRRSYAKTLEQLFYLSFLARDNKVSLFTQDEIVMVKPVKSAKNGSAEEQKRHQMVVSLSYKMWEELGKIYTCEPLIPDVTDTGGSNPNTLL